MSLFICIAQFDQGGLGLPNRNDYFKNGGNSSLVVAYKHYMATIASLFQATEEMVNEFVESTFAMEKELAKVNRFSIHSFILAISIAHFQAHYYSEALQTTARILYRSFTPKRTGNCR